MAIWDLFSKRQADAAKSGVSDVYQYDDIPQHLRVQVTQISIEAIGKVSRSSGGYGLPRQTNPQWDEIEKIFCRERGVYKLGDQDDAGQRVIIYMATCDTVNWIDLFELICITIEFIWNRKNYSFAAEWEIEPTDESPIIEMNYRLRQAGVGYQFEDGQLFRIDSQFVHAEVVKPALSLLSGDGFSGPQQEFYQAHQHYRTGEYRQAVAMAANALESTFKAVFDRKGWAYTKGARISDLMKVARANGLWPDYLDNSFDQLVATLQSGLPKIRDNDASHGQGSTPKEIPGYIAAYALHLAASKIVFVVEASHQKT